MTKVQELLGVFSKPTYRAMYLKAKATNTCMRCGKPVNPFAGDRWKNLEYKCSALCKNCQDYYFSTSRKPSQT